MVGVRGPHGARQVAGQPKRIQHLNEVKDLGVDTLRIEVKWNEVAPDPSSKTKPKFDASDPTAYASHPNAYPGLLSPTTTC